MIYKCSISLVDSLWPFSLLVNTYYSFVVGKLTVGSLAVGELLLFELVGAKPVLLMVDPTRSSNDLKAEEFLTSTNFLPMLSPREPKISVVFSAANLTVSLVFWYL